MESRFDELKRYLRWESSDLENLRALHAVAATEFPRISRDFYERIREHEAAHAVLTGEEQIQRLQASLVRWMGRVCTGERDDAYAAETEKIGAVHVRVGLPQRYVFTAMALIQVDFDALADARLGARATHVRASIARAFALELAVMLETYHDDVHARLQRLQPLEADLGRALARSEHHYANAVELAPYLVVGLDRDGRIALFNRAAERVSGYGRDEVQGLPCGEVIFAEEHHRASLDDLLSGRRASLELAESPLATRAGRMRLVHWQIENAPAEHEEVVTFAIGRDVTDEAALAERTRQAEKMAAVGTLAAGLAHEIRNPLNGAHLHITFLERGLRRSKADAEKLEAVRVVADEIDRLSHLVTDFLDFARPKPLQRQPVTIQEVCEKVSQLVARELAERGCRLELDLPAAPLVVDADRPKVEQVLLNLVQNANEAMAEGATSPLIVVRARRLPVQAVIEVEDHGPGIPDVGAPIYDAFYSTKPSGTGLGLAIVHRIVTDHGGSVTFESKPGRTIFRITFPLFTHPIAERTS